MDATRRRQDLQTLVAKYKETPDPIIFEKILNMVMLSIRGCIWFLTRNPYDAWYYYDKDELTSAMTLLLWKELLPTYDESKASFTTFCRRAFLNRAISIKRDLKCKKKIPRNITSPLTIDTEDVPDPNNWYQQAEKRAKYLDSLEAFEQMLSPFERAVLLCYIRGKSYKVTTRYLRMTGQCEVSTKSIDNALCRLRRKALEFKKRETANAYLDIVRRSNERVKRVSHICGRAFKVG